MQLRSGSPAGKRVGSFSPPRIEKGQTWVRVELLRGFGAHVQTDRQGAEVQAADRRLAGPQVGAKWRDYGWWVPLRRAAQALGWKITWLHADKAAVVTPAGR